MLYIGILADVLLFCLGPFVIWSWRKVLLSGTNSHRGWRAGASFGGLCVASLNASLALFLLVHSVLAGGFPYYHPVEMFCIFAGAILSLLGLGASVVGAGKLRLYVGAISIACLLIWFMDATSQ
jgi:hypothetical protein